MPEHVNEGGNGRQATLRSFESANVGSRNSMERTAYGIRHMAYGIPHTSFLPYGEIEIPMEKSLPEPSCVSLWPMSIRMMPKRRSMESPASMSGRFAS